MSNVKWTSDLKNLQGTWTVTAVEVDGNPMPSGGSKIVLDGQKFTTVAMDNDFKGKVELDPSASPKTFDLLFTTGPHKGLKSLGIYELDGDNWKICLAFASFKTRPKDFATAPGSGYALELLKRGDIPPTPEHPEPDAGPITELEGEWTMVSGTFDGHPMPASLLQQGRRIATGNRLTVLFGPQVFLQACVTLDLSASPKHIDYEVTSGAAAGATQLGIYQLDSQKLLVCMAPGGKPRPTRFGATRGDGLTLTTWKPLPK